jgi:NTE family protein
MRDEATIGLALGGGGAKGLAHVAVLRTLDAMGVRVSAISGTSIGAIIGAGYASGKSGDDLKRALDNVLATPRSFEELRKGKRLFGWLDLLGVEFGKSSILDADSFIQEMQEYVGVETFGELSIPLDVIAANFWDRTEVILNSGPLMPAVSASFCLPGIFRPVTIDGKILIDGGCVNPVPFDVLRKKCDIVIAVDVLGQRVPDEDQMPSLSEALFNSFQIAESSIVQEKMKTNKPDIYLQPDIRDVRVLDFGKSAQIYEQAESTCERLRVELSGLLDR